MSDARWRKSSFSGSQANCVEVAGQDERVLVRDTKDRAGAVLRFSPAAWRRFAEQAKCSLGRPSLGGAASAHGLRGARRQPRATRVTVPRRGASQPRLMACGRYAVAARAVTHLGSRLLMSAVRTRLVVERLEPGCCDDRQKPPRMPSGQ